MRVGVPTEIKVHEYRVGLTPSAVREYVARGHKVLVQSGAGAGIMATDEAYKKAGAKIAKTAEEVFAKSDALSVRSFICFAFFLWSLAIFSNSSAYLRAFLDMSLICSDW